MQCSFILVMFSLISVEAKDHLLIVEAVAGHSAELPCNVTADDPDDRLAVLLWYKNGTDTAIYSRDLRGEVRDAGGGRRPGRLRVVQNGDATFLLMTGVRPEDAGQYHCYAEFDMTPAHKTYVDLLVIIPPERLWVVQENGLSIGESTSTANHDLGPLYVGDQLRLSCVVFGGKPRPTLTWWTGGRVLKNTSLSLSMRRVRSPLAYGPLRREDHGRVLTCRAANNYLVEPLSIDITLDVYLPPELVKVRGPSAGVRAGGAAALQCRVLGARPPPDIIWRLNDQQLIDLDQNVTVDASQRLVVSEVALEVGPEQDEARVTCCAAAHDRLRQTYVCAEDHTLSVTYPPVVQLTADAELVNNSLSAVQGSEVMLNCNISANPPVEKYICYHGEDVIYRSVNASRSVQLELTLRLASLEEKDSGEYYCAAFSDEGNATSDTIFVDVTYPPTCTKDDPDEYGVGDQPISLTCDIKANPPPTSYRWMFMNGNGSDSRKLIDLEGSGPVLNYSRPSYVVYGAVICLGLNGISNMNKTLENEPCAFIITDETAPRPPAECQALRDERRDLVVTCQQGYDGGLTQNFTLIARTIQKGHVVTKITNTAPKFKANLDLTEPYEFVIKATNAKGDSESVFIRSDEIIDQDIGEAGTAEPASSVGNITTLSLALCGGVALLALAACGLVLCAHERSSGHDLPRPPTAEPALCAYNTEESNCETWPDSDEGSECHAHRSESFRRAVVPRHSPRNVRRSSSFNARGECRQSRRSACRVHSLQNINKRREMDVLCDHLAGYLPPELHYSYHKNPTAFYTMPRKSRHPKKPQKENSDEASEAQNSDQFSLPPPPDEFGSYRPGTRITAKDMPPAAKPVPAYAEIGKSGPSYTEIRTDVIREPTRQQYNNVIISPMNTVGLPTASGAQTGLYTYAQDDDQGVNAQRMPGTLTTFQSSYPRESGF